MRKYKEFKIPMRLQFFAEGGDGAGSEGGEGGGSEGGGTGGNPEPMSFDDFLREEGNQAEFDRRVNQAIQTSLKNAREKWELLADEKVSEAEKLAKMNKEEKAEYLRTKKEKELSDREAEITKRELMAEAKNTLAEKNLPSVLSEVLNYTDADSCKKSIEALESAFQKAVEAAVQDKLKGGEPPRIPGEKDDKTLESQVEKLMMGF